MRAIDREILREATGWNWQSLCLIAWVARRVGFRSPFGQAGRPFYQGSLS